MWKSSVERMKFRPQDGQEVVASGRLEVYPPERFADPGNPLVKDVVAGFGLGGRSGPGSKQTTADACRYRGGFPRDDDEKARCGRQVGLDTDRCSSWVAVLHACSSQNRVTGGHFGASLLHHSGHRGHGASVVPRLS